MSSVYPPSHTAAVRIRVRINAPYQRGTDHGPPSNGKNVQKESEHQGPEAKTENSMAHKYSYS